MTTLHPARDHLALALDVDSIEDAVTLVRRLRPWFGIAKVGLELFSAAGPAALAAVRAENVEVFADLKLHDIPTTVAGAARVIGRTGARFLTTHAAGGEVMVRAALDAFVDGAAAAGWPAPVTLAVTVLTSDGATGPAVFDERVAVAQTAGCPGLVCSPLDVARARLLAPDALTVCPGVRPSGAATNDQARVATPAAAIANGADVLVIGRAVTAAPDPAGAAVAVADEVASALAARPAGCPRGPGRAR